jgi:ketopantoate reductase
MRMDTPKKICVFGAGALGGAVAAKLATGLLALVSQLDRQNRRGG